MPVLAAMVPVVAAAWLVAQYGVDVPRLDDWSLATVLTCEEAERAGESCLGWRSLGRQHVESRPVTSRLLVIALATFVGFDVRWLMGGSVLAAGVVSLCVLWLARTTLHVSPAGVGWLWAATNVLLFGVAQAETWLHGAQVAAYLVLATLYGALLLSLTQKSPGARALGGVALAATGTFSMTSGLLAWVLVPPVFALWLGGRRRTPWLGVWALGAALALGLYFVGFEDRSPGDWQALSSPHLVVAYALVFLGAPFGSAFGLETPGAVWISGAVGVALTGVLAACLRVLVRRRERACWQRVAPWLAIAAFACGSAVMAGVGRFAMGVPQALAPRYFVWSLELGVALLFLVTIACEGRRRILRGASVLAAVLLVCFAATSLRVGLRLEGERARQLTMKSALAFALAAPERPWLGFLFPFPDRLVTRARILDARGLLAPPLVRSDRIAERADSAEPRPEAGAISQYRWLADELVLRGRAWLPQRGSPADAVLLCAAAPGGDARVVALLAARTDLGGEAAAVPEWGGRLSRARLREGETIVTAWAYDARLGRAFRLAGDVPVVAPSP